MSWNATSPPPGFEAVHTSSSTQLPSNSSVGTAANGSAEPPTFGTSTQEQPPRFGTAAAATPAFQPPPGFTSAGANNNHNSATTGAQADDPAARFRRSQPKRAQQLAGYADVPSTTGSTASVFSGVPVAQHGDLFTEGLRSDANGANTMGTSAMDNMNGIRDALPRTNVPHPTQFGAVLTCTNERQFNNSSGGHGNFPQPQPIPAGFQRNAREGWNGYHGRLNEPYNGGPRGGYGYRGASGREQYGPRGGTGPGNGPPGGHSNRGGTRGRGGYASQGQPGPSGGEPRQESARPSGTPARPKVVPEPIDEAELYSEKNQIEAGEHFEHTVGDKRDEDTRIEGGNGEGIPRIEDFGDGEHDGDQACNFPYLLVKNAAKLGVVTPTAIQKVVMPCIMKRTADAMAHAETGSGKTEAFLMPIIDAVQRIKDSQAMRDAEGRRTRAPPLNRDAPYAVILTVTRELVDQLKDRANGLVRGLDVKVAFSFGEMDMGKSKQIITDGCDIFVASFGRLMHIAHTLRWISLHQVRFFVIDEADQILVNHSADDMKNLIELKRKLPPGHRTLMFSATFGEVARDRAARDFLNPGYFFVSIGELNHIAPTIEQQVVEVVGGSPAKQKKLLELLEEWTQRHKDGSPVTAPWPSGEAGPIPRKRVARTLVFMKLKRHTEVLCSALGLQGYSCINITADRTQPQRKDASAKFQSGVYDVMVASDVVARGLNYPFVEHVVLYDLFGHEDQYVHRVGRTGRVGNKGHSIAFFNPAEDRSWAPALYRFLMQNASPIPKFIFDIIVS